jgi:hypothetical protein
MAGAVNTIADIIDTVEAIRRLTADISDQEVESGSDDQHDFVILARKVYRKREFAVSLLYAALCDGVLMAAIRLATGMLPITNMEWRTVALWREIIMSGEIQASAGERLERYNGAPVMLSTAAFEAWLQQRRLRPESPTTTTAAQPTIPVPPEASTIDPTTAPPKATASERLSRAIKNLWKAGERPGSTTSWKHFCGSIRADVGVQNEYGERGFSDRTIQRTVAELKKSGVLP